MHTRTRHCALHLGEADETTMGPLQSRFTSLSVAPRLPRRCALVSQGGAVGTMMLRAFVANSLSCDGQSVNTGQLAHGIDRQLL